MQTKHLTVCDEHNEFKHNEFKITITAKARHGILWGLRSKFGTNRALAKYLGVRDSELGRWINMKQAPAFNRIVKRKKAKRLERLFLKHGYTWEDIFPDTLRSQDWLDRPKDFEITKQVPLELLVNAGACPQIENPEVRMIQHELHDHLDALLKTILTPREEVVLRKRFYDNYTLEETAQDCGISRERIRQIEIKALHKLRNRKLTNGLLDYNDTDFTSSEQLQASMFRDLGHLTAEDQQSKPSIINNDKLNAYFLRRGFNDNVSTGGEQS